MRERVTVVTEKKPLFFYLESRTREHWKVNISRRKRWAFRQHFFPRTSCRNIWRIINARTSILCENMLMYLSLDITCSSKLTFSSNFALGKLFGTNNVHKQISVHIFAQNRPLFIYGAWPVLFRLMTAHCILYCYEKHHSINLVAYPMWNIRFWISPSVVGAVMTLQDYSN